MACAERWMAGASGELAAASRPRRRLHRRHPRQPAGGKYTTTAAYSATVPQCPKCLQAFTAPPPHPYTVPQYHGTTELQHLNVAAPLNYSTLTPMQVLPIRTCTAACSRLRQVLGPARAKLRQSLGRRRKAVCCRVMHEIGQMNQLASDWQVCL